MSPELEAVERNDFSTKRMRGEEEKKTPVLWKARVTYYGS